MARDNVARVAGLDALRRAFDNLGDQLETDERYAVGTPVDYGRFLEEGTSRMPAYPWLRPSVNDTVNNGAALAAQASATGELIRLAAVDIEGNARARLQNPSTRPYPQTGNLAGSIESVPME